MPNRKSPRADFHDYSGGFYFVTICTRDMKHYFGDIRDGKMNYTALGQYCHQQLEHLSDHYPYAGVSLFVVMPNHIHAVISIRNTAQPNLDQRAISLPADTNDSDIPTYRTVLSVIIGGLKRSVTLFARRNNLLFGWQPRYHDHIIRNHKEAKMINEYIENNVTRWASDRYCL